MLLVGANSRIVREPFILKGVVQEIWAGVLAAIYFGLTWWMGNKYLPEIIDMKDIDMYLSIMGVSVAFGIVFSWILTSLSVRKIISMKTDNLYN